MWQPGTVWELKDRITQTCASINSETLKMLEMSSEIDSVLLSGGLRRTFDQMIFFTYQSSKDWRSFILQRMEIPFVINFARCLVSFEKKNVESTLSATSDVKLLAFFYQKH